MRMSGSTLPKAQSEAAGETTEMPSSQPGAPSIRGFMRMGGFRSAEGRSEAAGETTELPSSTPPPPSTQDRRELSSRTLSPARQAPRESIQTYAGRRRCLRHTFRDFHLR
jgi:hypothetical protein